jgi:hypothetical protein
MSAWLAYRENHHNVPLLQALHHRPRPQGRASLDPSRLQRSVSRPPRIPTRCQPCVRVETWEPSRGDTWRSTYGTLKSTRIILLVTLSIVFLSYIALPHLPARTLVFQTRKITTMSLSSKLSITDLDLKGERVLIRVCSSSAMSGGAYSGVGDVELLVLAAMSAVCTSGNDQQRIVAALPTIKYAIDNGAFLCQDDSPCLPSTAVGSTEVGHEDDRLGA